MKLNLCKFPLSLTVKISVQGSTWSHTFTSLEDVPMAKFQNNVGVVQVRGQLTENQKKPKKAFIKVRYCSIKFYFKIVIVLTTHFGESLLGPKKQRDRKP